MSASHRAESGVGARVPRVEDLRLLTGRGRFVDDMQPDGVLYAVVVRSDMAHARLLGVDTAAAASAAGVRAVWTGEQLDALGIAPLLPVAQVNQHNGEAFGFAPMPVLARDKVRYVGEPVAFVVAESVAAARDAAELLAIDYEAEPAVTTPEAALADGAPEIAAEVPGNCCMDWRFGDHDAVAAAMAGATHVVSHTFHNHRIIAQPMEQRGALAEYDAEGDCVNVRLASQNVHVMRDHIARSLGREPGQVRVFADDVGGGFGSRNFAYPEYVLTAFAALALEAPVKWVNTRTEGCISDHHARDVTMAAELALDASGRFLAVRTRSLFAAGGYNTGVACGVPTYQYAAAPGSIYDIPHAALDIKVALTNTAPIGVTRGPGFAEVVGVLEQLIDIAAERTGIDRMELRRRNLVPAAAMPWTNMVGTCIDSGDFHACLDSALERAGYDDFAARRAASAAVGRRRGIGVACHLKGTGGFPEENVRFDFDGDRLSFTTGTQAIGQGHETSFRQIINELLGVRFEQIDYHAGDSAAIPMGGGHGSSRATFMASTAMSRAAARIISRGTEVAAAQLECAPEDVSFAHGGFEIAGTDRRLGLFEVAAAARDAGEPLDTYEHFVREALTWPNGCHVAEVEVDEETGAVTLVAYTVVDDHGTLVNPMLVEGQSHGAIMQGVAQALLEHGVYDPQSGQMLSGSFMDYAMPRAFDLPAYNTHFHGQRCTTNPLGVKGAGEPGAIAGYPAVLNAINDALGGAARYGGRAPASPANVWRVISGQTRA